MPLHRGCRAALIALAAYAGPPASGDDPPQNALARMTAAEVHVDLGGKEVWSAPQNHDFSPRESDWLYLTRKVVGR